MNQTKRKPKINGPQKMPGGIKSRLLEESFEFKTLGDIADETIIGQAVTRAQLATGNYPAVKCGDINSQLNIFFDRCISFVDEELISNKKYFEKGDILITNLSHKVETVGSVAVYDGEGKGLAGAHVVVIKHRHNPQFLACMLTSNYCRQQIHSFVGGSIVCELKIGAIRSIKISLPSRRIQDLIGNFWYELSKSITELSEKLKRENGDFSSTEMSF